MAFSQVIFGAASIEHQKAGDGEIGADRHLFGLERSEWQQPLRADAVFGARF